MRPFERLVLAFALLLLPTGAHAAGAVDHPVTLPTLQPGTLVDAVAGELPSAQRPRGTLLVAASLQSCGPAVVEWDVGHGRPLRQTCLGLPESNMRATRAGGTLDVLAEGATRWLVQIDVATLRIERRTDLGAGSYSSVATDGVLAAVASNARGAPSDAWSLTIVDRGGHATATTTLSGTLSSGPDVELAMLSGRVFAVTLADPPAQPKPRLVAFDSNAVVVGQIVLDTQVRHPWLAVKGNRLVVSLGSEVDELSPQLQLLARHTADAHGRLAVAADGRILTGDGEILSDAFTPLRTVDPGEPWVHAVLWLGPTPVIVGSAAEVVRHARIDWWDPL